MVKLLDIAHTNRIVVECGATLFDAYKNMAESSLGAVVALNGKKPVGILTERDAVRLLDEGVSQEQNILANCSTPLVTMELNNVVEEALHLMHDKNIRRIVVTSNGEFYGLVVQEDLLAFLEKEIYQSTLCIKHLDCAIKEIHTIDTAATLHEALHAMNQKRISSLPITRNGMITGVITERDAIMLAVDKVDLQKPVSEFAKPCIDASMQTLVYDLIQTMLQTHAASVIIRDDSDRPIGIISTRDLFRKLSQSHDKFLSTKLTQARQTLDFISDPVVELICEEGDRCKIAWMNKAALQIFGKELLSKPSDSILSKTKLQQILHLSGRQQFEKEKISFNERIFWAHASVAKIFHETIVQLVLEDVTQLESLNKNIQEQLRFQQQIIDTVPSPLFYSDLKGYILGCNKAFVETMGASKNMILGKKFSRVASQQTAEIFTREDMRLLQDGGSIDYEKAFTDPRGIERYGIFRKSAIVGKKGETVGIVGLFIDITEKKAIENRLQQLNEVLEKEVKKELSLRLEHEMIGSAIFETAPAGICMSDENRVITKLNRSFCSIFGFKPTELLGAHIEPLFGTTEENAAYREFIDGKTDSLSVEMTVYDKELKSVDIFVTAGRLSLSKGHNHSIWIVNDISHIKEIQNRQAQQERLLVQQSKMAAMGEMIGAIAHQWRQPLNALGLIVQDAKMAYEFGELNEVYIDNMVTDAKTQIMHMSQTIDDFRNFFHPEKEKERFEVKQAIEEILSMISGLLKNHTIEVSLSGETALIMGFPNEFKQVVLNLINNAKDAIAERLFQGDKSSETRSISISIKHEESSVYIEVCDRAGGIPHAIAERIFDPYFTTKEQGKGTGIGLYMSRAIIHNSMDGDIGTFNRDGGAVFWLRLPLDEG